MRPRQSLLELFSTFLQLDGDRAQTWVAEPRLRRSMQQCLAHLTATTSAHLDEKAAIPESEGFWALYWHKLYWHEAGEDNADGYKFRRQETSSAHKSSAHKSSARESSTQLEMNQVVNQLARAHLVAYIQEPCYWVAQKTVTQFSTLQYGLADCFQIAITQIDKVLRGFDARQGFSLKNYASATLASLIREHLRQRQEIDICTDWALLRKLSQKRLTEALHHAGLNPDTVEGYVLAWICFKTLYVPQHSSGTRKLPKPTPETWTAIAQLYNGDRLTHFPTASADAIEHWLQNCAKAARSYLYPNLVSINTPKPGQESGEFLDDLSETVQTDSLLTELIAAEETQLRQHQHTQVTALLTAALHQLDNQSQTLIYLYYRDGLTQQQMAERLSLKQYTVSRRLTKVKETLLLTLAKWSQDTLHITPTPDVLNHTSAALEEWLKTKLPSEISLTKI